MCTKLVHLGFFAIKIVFFCLRKFLSSVLKCPSCIFGQLSGLFDNRAPYPAMYDIVPAAAASVLLIGFSTVSVFYFKKKTNNVFIRKFLFTSVKHRFFSKLTPIKSTGNLLKA